MSALAYDHIVIDDDLVAVQAETRGRAKAEIAGLQGLDYVDVRVVRRWMNPCCCDGCVAHGPLVAHGYDEFWQYAEAGDPSAVEWWVQQW